MRLYVDSSKCTGCNACLTACSLNLFGEKNPKKAALVVAPAFYPENTYAVKVCTQCGSCAAVCPSGGIKKNEKGAWYVDFDVCTLCESCVAECPDRVMFVNTRLVDHAWKCNLCGDCVAVCEPGALWIGE
jgi:Fe-S-cluster-containing dehydrogenase component